MSKQVLIIDDEASIRQSLGAALRDEGYKTTAVASGREGLEILKPGSDVKFDVVFLDIWMPEMDGLEVLKQLKTATPEQMVIMMSGHGNIETAVKAVKNGAFDFVEKPLSLERILVLLQNASNVQDLARENVALRKQAQKNRLIVGESAPLKQIQELVKRVAPTTGSVLITGENGTGKDLVAQSIHAQSARSRQSFVEVNCAAIPEELIESELFGHEKGAFTGATQLRRGKFDLAHGGTLFLDEIGDMSLKTQAKILRILQEQKFERVGGSQTISVDVRIVAATNKDLKAEISKNNFREDLYYRLNVIPFVVPPLRDRQGDVPLLVSHFLKEFAASHGRPELQFSPEAIAVLSAYSWPGNVRELRNLIERIVILTPESEESSTISAATILNHLNDDALSQRFAATNHLPVVEDSSVLAGRNLKDARGDFEKDYIIRTLEQNDWNISRTAQILGIERSHLHRKIKSYGIETKE
jgi:two-component system nitrogen regulation response regulator NtrX